MNIIVLNGSPIYPEEVQIREGIKSYYTHIEKLPNVLDLDRYLDSDSIFRLDGLDKRCVFVRHLDGQIDVFDVIVSDDGSTVVSKLVKKKDDVLVKHKLLKYMKNPPEPTTARNRMGCSENWYDSFYAISQTFTFDQIEHMSEVAVFNLVKLAENIQEALY